MATSRQIGKTTIATVIILHYVLFNEFKTVFVLANKAATAQEVLGRVQLAYEYLPHWLKCGVVEWNKMSVEFENGSKVVAAATSSDAIRGKSCNMLYIDECITKDNIITIKNKKTDEIKIISIGDFYNLLN
jgi:phage terminase large subunit-like protein